MYGWLWRKLPGGWALKTVQSLAMIVVIAGFLVVVVFPWVEPKLPFSGNTVQDGVTQTTTPSPEPSSTETGKSKKDKNKTKTPAPETSAAVPVLPGE